jgi:small subunit ribosomal protein S1
MTVSRAAVCAAALSGCAPIYRGDLLPGDRVSVYIKAIVPERQKVKLIVIRTLPRDRSVPPLEYFQTEGSVSRWRYESDPLPAGV